MHMSTIRGLAPAAIVIVALVACESKITRDNFDEIEDGMTVAQVERILGKGEEQVTAGVGFGTSGMMDMSSSRGGSQRVFLWEEKGKRIIVTFTEGQVTSKTQQGLEE